MDYLNYKTISNELGYTYAFLLLFSTTCLVYLERISYYQGELFGVKLRSAYSNLIYQKVNQAFFFLRGDPKTDYFSNEVC